MKVTAILALVAISVSLSATSRVAPKPLPDAVKEREDTRDVKVQINWRVEDDGSRIDMGQSERRDGDVTVGQHDVVLPDGRRQVTSYKVNGDSGLIAEVRIVGDIDKAVPVKPVYTARP